MQVGSEVAIGSSGSITKRSRVTPRREIILIAAVIGTVWLGFDLIEKLMDKILADEIAPQPAESIAVVMRLYVLLAAAGVGSILVRDYPLYVRGARCYIRRAERWPKG